MGSSRHLGLIAALLALGLTLGVWWLLQAREIELPAGPPRGSPEVHEDAAAATAPMTTRVAVAGQTNAGIVKLPSEAGLPRTPPCSITAHVMDDAGSPVEGATVEVFAANYERRAPDAQDPREIVWLGPRRDAPLATMTTGSAGTCEFWFERELVYVTASHPRVGRSVVRTVGNRELGSDREVDLWLLRPVVVRGVVLDENCAPIPHARLFCEAATPVGKYGPTGWLSANAVGRFEFEVAAGLSSLVQARQGARLSPRVAFVAENDLEIVVALEGALSLRGVVRDAVGRPVVGASVQVKGFFGDQPVGQGQSRASVAYTPGFSAAITDRDGSFDLRVEACGRYAVAASAEPDLLSAWSEEVVVSFQDPHPRRNLVVAEALVLRVRVRNHDGSEAKMFELNVADAMDGTFILRATLPDGALALHLPLRTPVVLSGEGLTPVRVGPDAGELQLVLQPPPDPVEVTGAVFTSDGEPAKGILVE